MVNISVKYTGDLHCDAVHGPSKSNLATDAPIDNRGKGEAFSPTDLVATALATCMSTTMGIKAQELGVDLRGMRRVASLGCHRKFIFRCRKIHLIVKCSNKPRSIVPFTKVCRRKSTVPRNSFGKGKRTLRARCSKLSRQPGCPPAESGWKPNFRVQPPHVICHAVFE